MPVSPIVGIKNCKKNIDIASSVIYARGTYLFKTQAGYYFITETEASPLLMAVKEDDLGGFYAHHS